MTDERLEPICPRCSSTSKRRRHRPDLPCWRGRYAVRVTAHILASQGRKCWICGGLATSADHILPRSKGGDDDDKNLRPACLPHNSGRGNRMNPFTPDRATIDPTRLSARWRT